MDGFKIIEYRFAKVTDEYDEKYLANWSRPYEYRHVMDFILNHKQGKPRIHNTACGGHHEVHNIFRRELDRISDCIHSDITRMGNLPIVYYNITKENKEHEGRFDFVLNISTIEHVPGDKIKMIENLFRQVRPGGYLIMTFDYPKIGLRTLEPLLKRVCKKPDNCLTGVNSVSPNLDPEFNHEVVFLILQKEINDTAVFVDESSLFAAPFIAEALDAPLYVMYPQYNNFFGHGRQGIHWNDARAINGRNLIIIGYNALRAIADRKLEKRFESIAAILSDSWSLKYHKWVNKYVKATGMPIYCSHDMHKYFDFPAMTVYHTIRLKRDDYEKPKNRLIVSHSPNNGIKYRVKGSAELIKILKRLSKEYGYEVRLITNKKMDECIRLKGESHIFVDNFVYKNPHVPQDRFGGEIRYDGALSKSGIEAMMLGCCVLTGAPRPDDDIIPTPPVVWCSYEDAERKLRRVIEDEGYREKKIAEQKEWVKRYCSAEFIKKHITQHL